MKNAVIIFTWALQTNNHSDMVTTGNFAGLIILAISCWSGVFSFNCEYSTNIVTRVVSPRGMPRNRIRYENSLMKCVQNCFFRRACSKVYFSSSSSICFHINKKPSRPRKGYVSKDLVETDVSLWPSRLACIAIEPRDMVKVIERKKTAKVMAGAKRNAYRINSSVSTKKPKDTISRTKSESNLKLKDKKKDSPVNRHQPKLILKQTKAKDRAPQRILTQEGSKRRQSLPTSTLTKLMNSSKPKPKGVKNNLSWSNRPTFESLKAVQRPSKPTSSMKCSYRSPLREKLKAKTSPVSKEKCVKIPGYKYKRRSRQCLRYNGQNLTWDGARAYCWNQGVDLIMLDTTKKHKTYTRYLKKLGLQQAWLTAWMKSGMWIGLRTAPDGLWRWVDNSLYGTQVGTCGKCAATMDGPYHGFRYELCSEKKPFVCEI